MVKLSEKGDNSHEPWVRGLEHLGFRARFEGLAREWDGNNQLTACKALNNEIFEGEIFVKDRLVAREHDSPKPGAEVLQDCPLRRELHRFFAVQHCGRLGECLLEDELV